MSSGRVSRGRVANAVISIAAITVVFLTRSGTLVHDAGGGLAVLCWVVFPFIDPGSNPGPTKERSPPDEAALPRLLRQWRQRP